MADSNSTQENESKNSSPPSITSLAKCAAGAIVATMAIFFLPWGALLTVAVSVVDTLLSIVVGVFSPLAHKGVVAIVIALILTCVCFAIKHDASPAGKKALQVCILPVLVLALIGMSYDSDRPKSSVLKVAHTHPALYKKITQLTEQEQEKIKDIWKAPGGWDVDRHLTAELLGPDIEKMGTFEYRSFRRFLNGLGHNNHVKESLSIHGCRDMVAVYRQVKIPGAQLTVNDKIISLADGPDHCKWLGFNNLSLVTPD